MKNVDSIIIEAFNHAEAGTPEADILKMYPEAASELEALFSLRQTISRGAGKIIPETKLLQTILGSISAENVTKARVARHKSQEDATGIFFIIETIKTWISMSNKMLVGLLVIVFVLIGTIVVSSIGTPGSPVPEPPPPPQVTATPTPPPPAEPPAAADLDTILENIGTEEDVITSAETSEDEILMVEDEIINSYDINEEEL